MDAFAIRRTNLRRLILDKYDGNRAALSRASGINPNQINLLLTDNEEHRRNMGEALARRIEQALDMAPGQLDQPATDGAGGSTSVPAWTLSDSVQNALKPSTFLRSAVLSTAWIEAFDSRVTDVQKLGIAEVGTNDMAPDLQAGDTVLIDGAATSVTVDGIYLLTHGDDAFLRRVQKQLDGGFLITADPARHQPMQLVNLKRIKVHGRVLLSLSVKRV